VKVFLREFAEASIVYEIKYSLDDESRLNDIENEIKTNVWYESKRAGIHIPYPTRMVHLRRDKPPSAELPERARDILKKHDMLTPLSQAQQAELLAQACSQRFGRGEHIIHQGAEGSSMFIILEGEADVFVNNGGQDLHVATLREADAFGEMSLLTGEPRSADVVARTDCEIWELRRSVLQPLLQENIGLADRLSRLLAKRKIETEGVLAAQIPPTIAQKKTEEYAQGILQKIRALFEL
jgi:CRP-like cAMP-binding protein